MTVATTQIVDGPKDITDIDTHMFTVPDDMTFIIKSQFLYSLTGTSRIIEWNLHVGGFVAGSGATIFRFSNSAGSSNEWQGWAVFMPGQSLSVRATTGGGAPVSRWMLFGTALVGVSPWWTG